MAFPVPGSKITLTDGLVEKRERTVIASTWYREKDADWPRDMYTVLVLNHEAPYYTVAVVSDVPEKNLYVEDCSYDHMNVVPAVNGQGVYHDPYGYVDLGGDV